MCAPIHFVQRSFHHGHRRSSSIRPRLPATQPQDAQPHAPSAAPAPAGQSAAQPGQTLRDLAQNPEGQHPLGPAHAAPELSAAQKAAQQTNETLRQQLDPAD